MEKYEILTASVDLSEYIGSDDSIIELQNHLAETQEKLELYTSRADVFDYMLAVASGIISGYIDAKYIKRVDFVKGDLENSIYKVIEIALDDNKKKPRKSSMEKMSKEANYTGLIYSVARELQRVGNFKEENGELHFQKAAKEDGKTGELLGMAGLVGIMNWLINMAEDEKKSKAEEAKKQKKADKDAEKKAQVNPEKQDKKKDDDEDTDPFPAALFELVHKLASNDKILNRIKEANENCEKKMSDLGAYNHKKGDKNDMVDIFFKYTQDGFELPIMRDSFVLEQAKYLHEHKAVHKKLIDEIPLYGKLSNQMMPVIINELIVRTFYFIRNLVNELSNAKSIGDVNFRNVIPFNNRTIEQMIMISSMTFTFVDAADASRKAVRGIADSKGNFIFGAFAFAASFNYVGYGRAMLSIAKEISNDRKELQLLKEKRILAENKSDKVVELANEYQKQLEALFDQYMEEHLEDFIMGTNLIEEGRRAGDSNLIIKGNVIIQSRLGKEVQFTNQEEFDELMDSDIPLIL